MGVNISGRFVGGLAMEMVHDLSKTVIMTDPPLDNGGEGKSFSPTDLLATAIGACMMSVMAIYARKEGLDLTGMAASCEKHMSTDLPRRVARVDIVIKLPEALTPEQRATLEGVGNNCPVIHSIHPSIALNKVYVFS